MPDLLPYRTLRRLLHDSPVGVCLIDADAIITHIEGGALRVAGTEPSAWVGQPLEEPWRSQGWEPAMRGEVAAFGGMDPVKGERGQLICYAPRYNGRGDIVGAICWWTILGVGQSVEVAEGVSSHE